MMEEADILERGRQIERLFKHKDFHDAIMGGFIEDTRKSLNTGFDGSVDQIEGLKAIAYFEDWMTEAVEYAKQIQGELNDQ
jgi:hypothetical protein